MKKKRIWILLVLVVVLAGCGAGRREAREREREAQERERAEAAERLLEGKVEVPNTRFKTQEAVEALFEAAGLKVEFVVSNFDEKARRSERFLRAGECDDIDNSQAAVTYFDDDEVGDLYGFYADIGATIIVGYSDHDYDGTAGEEIEVPEVVEENNNAMEENDVSAQDNTSVAFEPQDVSDETIKSIKTYEDYLVMYQKIIENYFADYEAIVKDTVLYDEEIFAQMKAGYDEGFESQKEMYGSMGNARLVGKKSLVEFLISYRDGLKEYTDSIEESLR